MAVGRPSRPTADSPEGKSGTPDRPGCLGNRQKQCSGAASVAKNATARPRAPPRRRNLEVVSRGRQRVPREQLGELSLRETLLVMLVSAPFGGVLMILSAVIKSDVLEEGIYELLLAGLVGLLFFPAMVVVIVGGAKLWRWLMRDFSA